jgi:CheY-like chemotaxis protein
MSLIVLIEDNLESANLAKKLLIKSGHEVHLAFDGETGIMTVLDIKPDVILMDLGLPDIDGQTVVAMLKQQLDTSKTAIVAFTAWPSDKAHDMAVAYGCNGVITKPINTRFFVKQLESFLPKLDS